MITSLKKLALALSLITFMQTPVMVYAHAPLEEIIEIEPWHEEEESISTPWFNDTTKNILIGLGLTAGAVITVIIITKIINAYAVQPAITNSVTNLQETANQAITGNTDKETLQQPIIETITDTIEKVKNDVQEMLVGTPDTTETKVPLLDAIIEKTVEGTRKAVSETRETRREVVDDVIYDGTTWLGRKFLQLHGFLTGNPITPPTPEEIASRTQRIENLERDWFHKGLEKDF